MFHYEAEQARALIAGDGITFRLIRSIWRPNTLIDRFALQLLDIRIPQRAADDTVQEEILELCSGKCWVLFLEPGEKT